MHIMVMMAAKFLWLLRNFVPEYYHAKFGGNWKTNKGEAEEYTCRDKNGCRVFL